MFLPNDVLQICQFLIRDGADEFKDHTLTVAHLKKKKTFCRKAQNEEDQHNSKETCIFVGAFRR